MLLGVDQRLSGKNKSLYHITLLLRHILRSYATYILYICAPPLYNAAPLPYNWTHLIYNQALLEYNHTPTVYNGIHPRSLLLEDWAILCTMKTIICGRSHLFCLIWSMPITREVKHLARPGLGSALARLHWSMLIDFLNHCWRLEVLIQEDMWS